MMISIMSGLLFFIVANPETFKLVRQVLGGWVSSPTGCPTVAGLCVHAIVYFLLTWALMNVKSGRESADGDVKPTADTTDKPLNDNSASGGDNDITPKNDDDEDNQNTPKDTPKTFNSDDDDDDDKLNGVDTTFKLDMSSPHDQLNQYNKCACADGTEILVLK